MELVIFTLTVYALIRLARALRARTAKVDAVWYDGSDRSGIDRQLATAPFRGWS